MSIVSQPKTCAIIVYMSKKKPDFIDNLVAWGCHLLHLDKHTAIFQQLAKFVIVGFTNTAINWTIYFSAVQFANVEPLVASAIAFAIATVFNYWASTTWVFNTTNEKTKLRLFIEFTVFNGFAFLAFDEGLLWFLIYVLGWNYMIAKVVTTACGMVFNFITRKMFLEDRKNAKTTKSKAGTGAKKPTRTQTKHKRS